VLASQLLQEGRQQPNRPKANPEGWGAWVAGWPEGRRVGEISVCGYGAAGIGVQGPEGIRLGSLLAKCFSCGGGGAEEMQLH